MSRNPTCTKKGPGRKPGHVATLCDPTTGLLFAAIGKQGYVVPRTEARPGQRQPVHIVKPIRAHLKSVVK